MKGLLKCFLCHTTTLTTSVVSLVRLHDGGLSQVLRQGFGRAANGILYSVRPVRQSLYMCSWFSLPLQYSVSFLLSQGAQHACHYSAPLRTTSSLGYSPRSAQLATNSFRHPPLNPPLQVVGATCLLFHPPFLPPASGGGILSFIPHPLSLIYNPPLPPHPPPRTPTHYPA